MTEIEAAGFNGINGATGDYLPSPSVEEISRAARGAPAEGMIDHDLLLAKRQAKEETYGVPFGVDPADLAQTGWGLVFAHDASAEVVDALKGLREAPLVTQRGPR
ncbi:MAG: hypothetical protein ABI158_11690 [Edaphobacter sp.]